MRRRLLTALLSALCLALPGLARAQAWPSQPIHLMVGSAPGGGTDAMARVVAEPLGRLLGQQVIVENRPGVSNTLAAGLTARATDGHTVLMGVVTGHAIAPHLLKLGFDSNRDLVPVAYVGAVPNVLVIGPSVQAASVQALIQLSKQQTGGMNYATSGTGSTQHIAAILFQDATGVSMSQVPYKGSGPALVDLIGGQVQLSFDTLPSVIGQIRSHQLRALAVSTAQRNPLLPEVPTLAQAGVPGVEMSCWYGLYMPSGTPKAVQTRLHDALNQVLAQPDTRARLEALGAEARPQSQAEFARFHAEEYARFGALIQQHKLHLD